ncbi:T9SS type A sorting domain-containing protein [bacterium]|nr:T9SS type A sorting domain-containing protein [bacterium]
MKNVLFISLMVLFLFLPSISQAQIPNPGFETWNDIDEPVGWITNNIGAIGWITITRTNYPDECHSGNYAMRGEVILAAELDYPPGTWAEFPMTERYGELHGWYRYQPVDDEYLAVGIVLDDGNLGAGYIEISEAASQFAEFVVPITYYNPGTPTTATIAIQITEEDTDTPNVGAYFLLDDLSLSGIADVPESPLSLGLPTVHSLYPNFPNPFNPTTTFHYDVKQTGSVTLTVFDLLGQKVATLVDGQHLAGMYSITWNATGLPSGTYLCRMNAPGFSQVQKVMLVK